MMVDNLCEDDPYFYQACGVIAKYNPLMDSEYIYSFSKVNSGKQITMLYYVFKKQHSLKVILRLLRNFFPL